MASTAEALASKAYKFRGIYSFPAFWTLQPTILTRQTQLKKWSAHILSYCRHFRIWRLTIIDALNTPLFHNVQLRKRMTLLEVRDILDWMTREEGAQRAEWIGKEGEKESAWIYWRRPEEWAEALSNWAEETAQRNTVLTFYELTEGETTRSQEFHGMDSKVLQKSLAVLVKRGRAQIFGIEDEQGVKFF